MDDFEYSVEISDRDWQCFFTECEECNLLPPSLAGVDDSGMSDLDDTASKLAKRVEKVNLTTGFSETDHPVDGPPVCESPPVEHCLSKRGASGMESVLSGSEEDIHLQSVNMFFERLKHLTETERLAETGQVRAEKTREAMEDETSSGGQKATTRTLPKNTPKLNSLPARGETAVSKETVRPVDTIGNMNTMEKAKSGFNISTEPAASYSAVKTNRSAYPETELIIREEVCTGTRVKPQFHDSLEKVFYAVATPHTDKVVKVEVCTPVGDVKQKDLTEYQLTLSKKCSTDLVNNLEMLTSSNVLQPDATSTNKAASQESSPSASIKRKRRKKRRLSAEPAESGLGYERQVLVKQRTEDSEEELHTRRGAAGFCLSEDMNTPRSHELPKNTINHTVSTSAKEEEANYRSHSDAPKNSQDQSLPESRVGQAEIHPAGNSQSVISLSHMDDRVRKALRMSGNVITHLQPCMELPVEELSGLNKYCCLPHSVDGSVPGKSDVSRGTGKGDRIASCADSLQLSNKMNHANIGFEKEQNLKCCTAEVNSVTPSVLPRADSNDPEVEVSQNDKLSAAKSVLAVEAGNSDRYNHTLCQRETEHQQQLEIDTDQNSSTPGKTHFPPTIISTDCYVPHNKKHQQFKTKADIFTDDIFSNGASGKLTDDCTNSCSDGRYLPVKQTEKPLEDQTSSKSDTFLEKNAADVTAQSEPSQITLFQSRNPCSSGETNVRGTRQRETELPTSEALLTSPSDITPLSSRCTLDTESVTSLSNENITARFCENESGGHGEIKSLMLEKHIERDATYGPKSQAVLKDSTESEYDLLGGAENVITPSKKDAEKCQDCKQAVFTMSSFWSDMEKLTINDILRLRMADKAAPPNCLPSLQENEETDTFATNDSGFFMQLNPEQTTEHTLSTPDPAQSSLGPVMILNSSSSSSVTWEGEPVHTDIYPGNVMLTSAGGICQPVLSAGAGKCPRKISKNVSVHNLRALECEPFSSTWRHQTLPTFDQGGLEKVESFTEHVPRKDDDMDSTSSVKDSYTSSIVDLFRYFFGGKKSTLSQSATDNTTTFSTYGNSIPETYDYFFSDFDTESFFCPLFTAEEQSNDELVPIFSCSRSANRNLQFPEAYDYFFPSSSSDDSTAESDDEDNSGPVRVVTRSSGNARTSQISADVYEDFFTDKDLTQNFFWKNTLSFRNLNLTGSAVQKKTPSNSLPLLPVRQSDTSPRRTVYPCNVLGNQDIVFTDPLLSHLEERISKQLLQQPFRYEDLETAVSNPSKSHFTH